MPFINVKVNVPVPSDKAEQIKASMGQAITAIPGKSEQWLMVGIEPESTLYFQGSPAPAAMVEVSVYGGASASACNSLTGKICTILDNSLSIPANRVYVRYFETDKWGWNDGNF